MDWNNELRMHSTIFFLRLTLTTILALVTVLPAWSQENEQAESVQKKITEPLYRITKVASNNVPDGPVQEEKEKIKKKKP